MVAGGEEPTEPSTRQGSQLRQILSLRAVHYMAAFVLIYVGVEVTLGGASGLVRWSSQCLSVVF